VKQDNIWDFFQNRHEVDAFKRARPRYEFLSKKIAPSLKVLNIGVGKGGLEDILIAKNVDMFCLDPSVKSIEAIRHRHGLKEKAQVGYSQSMPFDDSYFDAVVMSEVLEHLDEDVTRLTLNEVKRVLKPGGIFIGTVPANEVLADNLVICPDCEKTFHRWGHVQSFSPARMLQLLFHFGFVDCQVEVRAFPDWNRRGAINLVKSGVRYILGRAGLSIANPNIYFNVRRSL